MASTPSQGQANNGVSLDAIAQYLVENSFLLTGLELLQECTERGRQDVPAVLKDAFTPAKLEELLAQEDISAAVNKAKENASAQRPPEDSGRIALLEYELRQERANLQTLRLEMSSLLSFSAAANKNNTKTGAPGSIPAGGVKDLKVEPVSATEKRIINYLIKKYLVEQGYHLTAISLSSEVHYQATSKTFFLLGFCFSLLVRSSASVGQYAFAKTTSSTFLGHA